MELSTAVLFFRLFILQQSDCQGLSAIINKNHDPGLTTFLVRPSRVRRSPSPEMSTASNQTADAPKPPS